MILAGGMTTMMLGYYLIVGNHERGGHDAANAPTDPEARKRWEAERERCAYCNPAKRETRED